MSTTDQKGHDSDPLIGQNIAENRYKIIKIIGEGGMGKVYLGEQKLGDRVRPVAIKTLQPDLAGDPQIIARFHREAGTVSLLTARGARVVRYVTQDGTIVLLATRKGPVL